MQYHTKCNIHDSHWSWYSSWTYDLHFIVFYWVHLLVDILNIWKCTIWVTKNIFPWMKFIVKSQENFSTNLSTHIINTMNKHNFHRTSANLSCFPKSKYYASIRIFSSLPCSLIILSNEKTKFEIAWSQSLNSHTFHSVMNFFYV